MSERIFSTTEKLGDYCLQLRPSFSALNSRLAKILKPTAILFLLLLLVIPARTYPQTSGTFAAKPIIENVRKRYKLNKKELSGISRIIKQENIEVLGIYARFGGDEPEYSEVLWQAMVIGRIDFEHRVGITLSNRQKIALKAARMAFEDRVLSLVVDDFIYSLGQALGLDSLDMEAVENVLYPDYKRKHRLIVKQYAHPLTFEKGLKAISDETERGLKEILTPQQFRDYRKLTAPADLLVGDL